MWLLGEDGSERRGGGITSSPGIPLPRQLSGGRKWEGQGESLPQGSLVPARGPQGTSQVFKPLGFFHSMRKMPSLLQGALTLLAKAGSVLSPQHSEALHSTQHNARVSSASSCQRAPAGVREEAPGPGSGSVGAAAVGAAERGCTLHPQLAFLPGGHCLPAPCLCPLWCSSQMPCFYIHSNVILADPY